MVTGCSKPDQSDRIGGAGALINGDECADIPMLLAAIRGGVKSLMAEILENHIRPPITHPNRGPDAPEELTGDLISPGRAYLQRC
jgi:DNA-binding FrmR family transcriptional regulator